MGPTNSTRTMVKQIPTKAEYDKVLADAGGKLVVIDFTATWCGPCQRIAPKFVEWEGTFKVDVDENEETAAAYGVSAMPTFKFIKGGQKVGEVVGANEAAILAKITE